MDVPCGQHLGKTRQRLHRQKSEVGQSFRSRLLLEPFLRRTGADQKEHNLCSFPQKRSSLEHAFQSMFLAHCPRPHDHNGMRSNAKLPSKHVVGRQWPNPIKISPVGKQPYAALTESALNDALTHGFTNRADSTRAAENKTLGCVKELARPVSLDHFKAKRSVHLQVLDVIDPRHTAQETVQQRPDARLHWRADGKNEIIRSTAKPDRQPVAQGLDRKHSFKPDT